MQVKSKWTAIPRFQLIKKPTSVIPPFYGRKCIMDPYNLHLNIFSNDNQNVVSDATSQHPLNSAISWLTNAAAPIKTDTINNKPAFQIHQSHFLWSVCSLNIVDFDHIIIVITLKCGNELSQMDAHISVFKRVFEQKWMASMTHTTQHLSAYLVLTIEQWEIHLLVGWLRRMTECNCRQTLFGTPKILIWMKRCRCSGNRHTFIHVHWCNLMHSKNKIILDGRVLLNGIHCSNWTHMFL